MHNQARRTRSGWFTGSCCAFAVLVAGATVARAQCTGDCGGDSEVTVDEIITMVNIANGVATLDTCPAADGNGDSLVAIDDIISAVNNATNGCPAPTPTPTPTPTQGTVTPNPTPTVPALCGNGVVNFDVGETCDDGNLVEGDSCPANCRIRTCTPDGTTLDVNVSFAPPDNTDIAALSVFLRYQEDRVRIPGSRDSQLTADRLTNSPENAFFQHNDRDYGLQMVVVSFDQSPILPGTLFTVQFDNCSGAVPPGVADFLCRVDSASTPSGTDIPGTTCSVSIP